MTSGPKTLDRNNHFAKVMIGSFSTTYAYLCGYARTTLEVHGESNIDPETLRDLEYVMLELGMTEDEVACLRDPASHQEEPTPTTPWKVAAAHAENLMRSSPETSLDDAVVEGMREAGLLGAGKGFDEAQPHDVLLVGCAMNTMVAMTAFPDALMPAQER